MAKFNHSRLVANKIPKGLKAILDEAQKNASPEEYQLIAAAARAIHGHKVSQRAQALRWMVDLDSTDMASAKEWQRRKEAALGQLVLNSKDQLDRAISMYNMGRIRASHMRNIMASIIRRQGIAAAIVGVGGSHNLTQNIMTAVGRVISLQIAYLDDFVEDVTDKKVTRRDRYRAITFATAVQSIALTAFRQMTADFAQGQIDGLEERRNLGPDLNCQGCYDLAGYWAPFGTLPPPGQGTECGTNCKCTMEIRQKDRSNSVSPEDQSLFDMEPGPDE